MTNAVKEIKKKSFKQIFIWCLGGLCNYYGKKNNIAVQRVDGEQWRKMCYVIKVAKIRLCIFKITFFLNKRL